MHDMAVMLNAKKKTSGQRYGVVLTSKLCRTNSSGMSKLTTLVAVEYNLRFWEPVLLFWEFERLPWEFARCF
jgi:hypothetical protein